MRTCAKADRYAVSHHGKGTVLRQAVEDSAMQSDTAADFALASYRV